MAWKQNAVWLAGIAGAAGVTVVGINLVFSPGSPEDHYVAAPSGPSSAVVSPAADSPEPLLVAEPIGSSETDTASGASVDSDGAMAWKGALAALGVTAENVKAEPGRLIFSGLTLPNSDGDTAKVGKAVVEGLEPASMAALLGNYDGVVAQRLTFSGIALVKEDGSRADAGELVLTRPYYQATKSGKRVFRGEEVSLRQVKAVDKGVFAGSVEEISIVNAGIEFGGEGKGALLLSQDPAHPPSIRIKNFSAPAHHAGDESVDVWREALGIDMLTGSLEISYAPQTADNTVRDLLVSLNLADMAALDLKTSIAPRDASEEWLRLSGKDSEEREVPDVLFHGFTFDYRDNSLMVRVLDQIGREQGKSGEEVAQEVSLMAAFLTMAAGNEGAAKLEPLTRSLSEFLRKPARFSFSVEAIRPIALAEISGEDGIKPDIIKLLRIKASAGD